LRILSRSALSNTASRIFCPGTPLRSRAVGNDLESDQAGKIRIAFRGCHTAFRGRHTDLRWNGFLLDMGNLKTVGGFRVGVANANPPWPCFASGSPREAGRGETSCSPSLRRTSAARRRDCRIGSSFLARPGERCRGTWRAIMRSPTPIAGTTVNWRGRGSWNRSGRSRREMIADSALNHSRQTVSEH
jgi:hypothetical protein